MKSAPAALTLATLAAFAGTPSPAAGDGRIRDRADFVEITDGRDMTAFAVRLKVLKTGEITGRAFGSDVSGNWDWADGYFCRVMTVGARTFPKNCQTVVLENGMIVFTADEGTGDQARLRLR